MRKGIFLCHSCCDEVSFGTFASVVVSLAPSDDGCSLLGVDVSPLIIPISISECDCSLDGCDSTDPTGK